jgi:hypothetical protein
MILRHCVFPVLLIAAAFFYGCTTDPVAGGSGSTTTNGFTASIRDSRGSSVANAVVHVRLRDYCATGAQVFHDTSRRLRLDTITGADGSIAVGSLEPGSYTIEFADTGAREGVVLHGEIVAGGTITFGEQRTQSVGALSGAVDLALVNDSTTFIVQIPGMERFASVDPNTGRYFVAALPPDTYSVRLASDDTAFDPVALGTITVATGDTARIDPFVQWTRQGIVTINMSAAGMVAGETVVNFPLLLRLDRANFDFATAKKKGGDLRITKTDGSIVRYEIDWWDSAGGTAAVWALLDTLRTGDTARTLNLFWGNNSAGSLSAPASVFDTASGYAGVWHLNESGGTLQKDATSWHNDGTPGGMDGGNDITGIIGRSQRFEGDSTRVVVASSGVTGGINNVAMISVWIKLKSPDDTDRTLLSSLLPGYSLVVDGGNRWVWPMSNPGDAADSLVAPASAETWALLTTVRRGSLRYFYVNGSVVDSSTAAATTSPVPDGGFIIGCRADRTGYFNGVVDELRMHRTGLSSAWIRCCYETQREGQQVISIRQTR